MEGLDNLDQTKPTTFRGVEWKGVGRGSHDAHFQGIGKRIFAGWLSPR